MKSDDWQPMETAPLNPYGKPWGPPVLIWDGATGTPVSAYFEPWHGYKDRDCGPAWVVNDGVGDSAIAPDDALAWMPIAAPWAVLNAAPPQEAPMTAPDTDTLAGLREELRLIGCHQNGDARCTCAIGADALDAIDALRAQAAKDKARIERLEAALREISNCGQSVEPDNWRFRSMARGKARAALEDGE